MRHWDITKGCTLELSGNMQRKKDGPLLQSLLADNMVNKQVQRLESADKVNFAQHTVCRREGQAVSHNAPCLLAGENARRWLVWVRFTQ